ncbi:hypothetical protein DFH06DRAFT_1401493 [Mycena polygramma]|nr:hypothetical protein DFH06DRAFT_1401493 [Mycena polygramma]
MLRIPILLHVLPTVASLPLVGTQDDDADSTPHKVAGIALTTLIVGIIALCFALFVKGLYMRSAAYPPRLPRAFSSPAPRRTQHRPQHQAYYSSPTLYYSPYVPPHSEYPTMAAAPPYAKNAAQPPAIQAKPGTVEGLYFPPTGPPPRVHISMATTVYMGAGLPPGTTP